MKRHLVVSAITVLSLVFAGCSDGPLPGEAVANAAGLAQEQGSSRFSMEISMNAAGQAFTIDGAGAIDFANSSGYMTMTPKGLPQGADAMLGSIEAVFTKTVYYMRMDGMQGYLPAGKEWIKIDLQALGEDQGVDFLQLQQLGQSDPSQQLDYLRGVSDVKEVGTETVRGVETTHYEAVIDYDRVAEKYPAAAESLDRVRKLTGLDSMPVEVWLDEDGLPRRMSMNMEMKPGGQAQAIGPMQMDMVMDFFDYGSEVDVQIPDESTVMDPSKLQG